MAVRVILAKHVPDDCRRFLVWSSRYEPELIHRVKHATVHWLEPIAHVRQGARYDDAHGVVDEGFLHLIVNEAWKDPLAIIRRGHLGFLRAAVGGKLNPQIYEFWWFFAH